MSCIFRIFKYITYRKHGTAIKRSFINDEIVQIRISAVERFHLVANLQFTYNVRGEFFI